MGKSVFLFVTYIRDEERRIVDFLKLAGHQVTIKTDGCPFDLRELSDCDVALIRILSQKTALQRVNYLEAAGVRCVNSSNAIRICTDKGLQAVLFERESLPIPKFSICGKYDELPKLLGEYGRFVIKPMSASWGRGVTLIEKEASLDAWVGAREAVDTKGKHFPVLVQEYIEKDNFDIRVVIVGRTPIVAFRRINYESWKTNTHTGASIIPMKLTKSVITLVDKIVNVVGAGIYGLDLMVDKKTERYVICEINQNPEFAKSWLVHGVDVAQYIAEYITSEQNLVGVDYAT